MSQLPEHMALLDTGDSSCVIDLKDGDDLRCVYWRDEVGANNRFCQSPDLAINHRMCGALGRTASTFIVVFKDDMEEARTRLVLAKLEN